MPGNYHESHANIVRRLNKKCLAFFVGFFLLLISGGLVVVIGLSRSVNKLQRRLSKLDRDLNDYSVVRYEEWLSADCSDGLTVNPLTRNDDTSDESALKRLRSFERLFKRSKRRAPVLTRTSQEFSKYREAYKNYVENFDMDLPLPEESDTRSMSRTAYNDALKKYAVALGDVSRNLNNGIIIAAVIGLFGFLVAVIATVNVLECTHRDVRKRCKTLFDGLTNAALLVDDSNSVIVANSQASEIFGRSDFVGVDLESCFLDDGMPDLRGVQQQSQQRALGVAADGSTVNLALSITKINDVRGRPNFVIECQDKSNDRALELELDIQKKVMSQVMHEIRNKNVMTKEMLETSLDVIISENCASSASRSSLKENVLRGLELVQDINNLVETRVMLHKLYAGTYQPTTEIVDLRDAMRNTIQNAATTKSSKVKLRALFPDCHNGSEIFAKLDMFMFRLIATNFISNARKATERGTITFEFLDEVKEETNDREKSRAKTMLRFAVTDTGRGVSEELIPKIFISEVVNPDHRGVGLGLKSCRYFSQAIGGDCWLQSTIPITAENYEKEHGSSFHFELPGEIVKSSTPPPPTNAPVSIEPLNLPEDVAVFIVEDSQLIRRSIIKKLSKVAAQAKSCFNYVEYSTCESLLLNIDSVLSSGPASLITVDQHLTSAGGRICGTALIRELRARNFTGVIASVSGDRESELEHLRVGADVALGKPLSSVPVIAASLKGPFKKRLATNANV